MRLRYENGYFVPLDPVPELEEGDEIDVTTWTRHPTTDDIQTMLDRTRGAWSDWPAIEDSLADARGKWLQEWRNDLSSS